jgi:hypothetical protein
MRAPSRSRAPPMPRERSEPGIWERQGPRRQRAQRAQAGDDDHFGRETLLKFGVGL